MKRAAQLIYLGMLIAMGALPVFAQGEAGKPPEHVAIGIVVAAGFSMALAAGLCGLGQGKIGAAACEGIARNPGAGGAIRLAMILGLVFIETLALLTFAIVFAKVSY